MELDKLKEMNAWRDANGTTRRETAEHFGVTYKEYDAAIARQKYHKKNAKQKYHKKNVANRPQITARKSWTEQEVREMVNWQKVNNMTNNQTADHFGIGRSQYQGAKTRSGLITGPIKRKEKIFPSIQRSQPTKPLQAPVEYIDLPHDEVLQTEKTTSGGFVVVICPTVKSLKDVIEGVCQ